MLGRTGCAPTVPPLDPPLQRHVCEIQGICHEGMCLEIFALDDIGHWQEMNDLTRSLNVTLIYIGRRQRTGKIY